ncbi:carbon-nitrogen hydrolase [Gongronella butleri]|nr:carbon-nitrogen hydrolase [Gongronella butleri]
MGEKYRVAAAQVGTVKFDLELTMAKLEAYLEKASAQGVQMIVFPEAFIGGYPRKSNFGCVIGSRSPEGRQEFIDYHKGAIEVPGPVTDRLAALANKHALYMVIGVIERDALSGTLYCSAIHVDPEHGYVAKHRKLMPTASERLCWGAGDGSTLPVVTNNAGIRVGATICWENYMPLLRSHLYSKGVQIYCAPTVDHRAVWQSTMTHIALEGRCFVVSACQFTRQEDYPDGHAAHAPDGKGLESEGGSVIISPLGEVLAGPLREEEGLVVADIDIDEIIGAKLDFDPIGHYARNDIFTLTVNEKPQQGNVTNQ